VLQAFLQPDIEFPPFAPAETGGRVRYEDDKASREPGKPWLQTMSQAPAETGGQRRARYEGDGASREPGKLWHQKLSQQAPAETAGRRDRARESSDAETCSEPGELWLQMMAQANAEIESDNHHGHIRRATAKSTYPDYRF
jgi:hypothetical protein